MPAPKFALATAVAGALTLAVAGQVSAKGVMLMNRIGPSKMELFIANADGTGERKLMPTSNFDYDPTFSADGKWIVFTSERSPEGTGQADIYRIHPDGAGLEQLTRGPSMEDAGALSPDGTKLTYVSTKGGARTTNIWVMDLKTKVAKNLTGLPGTAPQLTMNSFFRPSWSPDGEWIAFSSDRGEKWAGAETGAGVGHSQPTSVYIIRADGTGMRRLTMSTPDVSTGSPHWSPDGKTVVAYQIATRTTFGARMGIGPQNSVSQIVSIDVATGAVTPVVTGPGLKVSPQYLGAGKIAYLIKSSPKDGPAAGIAYSTGEKGPQGMVRAPTWSPDGKQVAYYKIDITNRPQYTKLYSWDPTLDYRYTDVFPSLCEKSGKLAITDLNFPFGNPDASVSVMNPDGTGKVKVFQRKEAASMFTTWSPDCQQIAFGFGTFFGGRDFRPANIMVVKADGSEVKDLTNDKFNTGFPAWSPDGKTMVYRVWGKDADGKELRGLRTMNLADHTVKVLTTEWDNFPFFSPNGDRIVFTRQMPDKDFEVFTMKPDGTQVKRLTTTRGADAHATWSADGKQIWFESSRGGFKDEAALYDTSPQPYAQIYLMNRDGTNVRQFTDSKWEDSMGTFLKDK
jgi:Tol biopolymer transport system component